MGSIGLSRQDFCLCSPSEFMAVYDAYADRVRGEWERTRVIAYCCVVPYMKERVSIDEFMPIGRPEPDEWDERMDGLSEEERFERAKKLMGAVN